MTVTQTALITRHMGFGGEPWVRHADPDCGFVNEAIDILRPDQTLLPGETLDDCRFCIGGDAFAKSSYATGIMGHEAPAARTYGSGEGIGHSHIEMATEKQLSFIAKLQAERNLPVTDGTSLTKRAASNLIETLLNTPKPVAEVTAAPAANVRPNKFAGRCVRCGQTVAEGAGTITKNASGKWDVSHTPECPAAPAATTPAPAADLADVPSGHYAIESTGDNDLAFYRVDRPTTGQYAGRTFVKLVVGGHPDSNVRYAAIPGILARITEAGIAESAARYGQEIGRCCRCNRHLTDEDSRAKGIGPECEKKGF